MSEHLPVRTGSNSLVERTEQSMSVPLHLSSGRADNLYIVTVMRALVVVLVDPHAQDAVHVRRRAPRAPERVRFRRAGFVSCVMHMGFVVRAFFNPAFRHCVITVSLSETLLQP